MEPERRIGDADFAQEVFLDRVSAMVAILTADLGEIWLNAAARRTYGAETLAEALRLCHSLAFAIPVALAQTSHVPVSISLPERTVHGRLHRVGQGRLLLELSDKRFLDGFRELTRLDKELRATLRDRRQTMMSAQLFRNTVRSAAEEVFEAAQPTLNKLRHALISLQQTAGRRDPVELSQEIDVILGTLASTEDRLSGLAVTVLGDGDAVRQPICTRALVASALSLLLSGNPVAIRAVEIDDIPWMIGSPTITDRLLSKLLSCALPDASAADARVRIDTADASDGEARIRIISARVPACESAMPKPLKARIEQIGVLAARQGWFAGYRPARDGDPAHFHATGPVVRMTDNPTLH